MALGDASNYQSRGSSNGNRVYDNTYYSRLRIKNKDHLAVGFTFSKCLLRVTIYEEKENYMYDEVTSITLSPTKAKLLADELTEFIRKMKDGEHIDPNTGVGVNTGIKETISFIAFKTTGNRTDVPEHSFVIGKAKEDGSIDSFVEFVFNVDYNYSLEWNNVDKMKYEKKYNQFTDIQNFLDVLIEFANSSAGAIGAAVWDTGRYDMNRLSKKIDPIYDKLGIERQQSNNNGTGSYNNRGVSGSMNEPEGYDSRTHSTSKTLEDIEDMLS